MVDNDIHKIVNDIEKYKKSQLDFLGENFRRSINLLKVNSTFEIIFRISTTRRYTSQKKLLIILQMKSKMLLRKHIDLLFKL